MDKAKFYATLRKKDSGVFGSRLTQGQVNTLELLLDKGFERGLLLPHLSYVLATTYHEVGPKMQPIAENLNYTSAASIRKVWPSRFKTNAVAKPFVRQPQKLANHVYGGRLGNTGPNDGWMYRGRGFPQTTGKENYARSGMLVGIDLVANPDRMLEPMIAAVTMIESMVRGLYTGKKLADYLDQPQPDYLGARAIINADVKKNGTKIARYAQGFAKALQDAGYASRKLVAPSAPLPREPISRPAPVPMPEVDRATVLEVQRLLREKGYPEVGNVDGNFGTRTRNAILAFEADNGLPLLGRISNNLISALVKAAPRVNSAARTTATEKELKDAPTVRQGDWLRKLGIGILGASGLGGLLDGTASLDQIRKGLTDGRALLDTIGTLGPWVLGIGAGVVVLFFAQSIIREQVKAYREGRHV